MKTLTPILTHLRSTHGVTSTRDLIALGFTRDDIARLLELGVLSNVAVGTHLCPAVAPSAHQQLMVAIVAARQRARHPELVAAARDSAAWLLGLSDPRRVPSTVQLVVPHARTPSPRLPRVRVHRSRTLLAEHLTVVEGVPTTNAARTIVDSAINHSVDTIRERAARGLRSELFTLDELSEQLWVAGAIRGARRMHQAMLDLSPDQALAESRGEELAHATLSAAGFEVVRQHEVTAASRLYRLDLFILALQLAIEIDGYWWHSTPQQRTADLQRQNDLVESGFRVLRFAAAKVVRDPSIVVAGVRNLAANL